MNFFGDMFSEVGDFFYSLDHKENKIKFLIKHSEVCKNLRYEYQESIRKHKPIMTEREFQDKLREIVSNPAEEKKVFERVERDEIRRDEEALGKLVKKEFGKKYRKQIFSIFSKIECPSYSEFQSMVNNDLRLEYEISSDSTEVYNIFWRMTDKLITEWEKNNLVFYSTMSGAKYYTIGETYYEEWRDYKKSRQNE